MGKDSFSNNIIACNYSKHTYLKNKTSKYVIFDSYKDIENKLKMLMKT